jgi:hypothetical protein
VLSADLGAECVLCARAIAKERMSEVEPEANGNRMNLKASDALEDFMERACKPKAQSTRATTGKSKKPANDETQSQPKTSKRKF